MNTFSRLLYLVFIILLACVFIEGENLRSRYNGGEIIVACMSASRNREFQQKLMVSLQTKEYLYDHENFYKILHTRPIITGFLPYLITMKLLYSPEQTLFEQFQFSFSFKPLFVLWYPLCIGGWPVPLSRVTLQLISSQFIDRFRYKVTNMSDPQSVLRERTQDGGKGRQSKKSSLINHSINSWRKVHIWRKFFFCMTLKKVCKILF